MLDYEKDAAAMMVAIVIITLALFGLISALPLNCMVDTCARIIIGTVATLLLFLMRTDTNMILYADETTNVPQKVRSAIRAMEENTACSCLHLEKVFNTVTRICRCHVCGKQWQVMGHNLDDLSAAFGMQPIHKEQQKEETVDSGVTHPWVPIKQVLDTVQSPDWTWALNSRCKYLSIRIDTRDSCCIVSDRNGVDIALEELSQQYGQDALTKE